jgi:hypothetical protein
MCVNTQPCGPRHFPGPLSRRSPSSSTTTASASSPSSCSTTLCSPSSSRVSRPCHVLPHSSLITLNSENGAERARLTWRRAQPALKAV